MLLHRKTRLLNLLLSTVCFAWMFSACTVKNYPVNKPFVYENKINVTGNVSKDEKKRLTLELDNYWDDSLKARKVRTWLFAEKRDKPPLLDTANITRTKKFMTAYLNSQGYYYATINDSLPIPIDTVKGDQYRATIVMNIDLGKNISIDSVSYALYDTSLKKGLQDTALQKLAMKQFSATLLKKGTPYKKQLISDELDRLKSWFRRNGYYGFKKEDMYALVDTSDDKLLILTLDPFEQARLIAEAAKRRKENPTWDVQIRQREILDSAKLRKYYIGDIYYYPETGSLESPDSLLTFTYDSTRRSSKWRYETRGNRNKNIIMLHNEEKFILRPMREHTYLRKDSTYNEDLYLKSINTLSQIPSWRQVDVREVIRNKDTIDLHFFLVPEKKYQASFNLEGSRNTGDFFAGNLLGLGFSTTFLNRNAWQRAIQSSSSLRTGIELNINKNVTGSDNGQFIQTFQAGISHSFSFPRIVLLPLPNKWARGLDNKRTIMSGSASYTERFNTYRLRSAVASLGWEGQRGKNVYFLKLPNIELYKIDTLPLLKDIFESNPFLRNSFNNGNVIGFGFTFTRTMPGRLPNRSHLLRLSLDQSGFITDIVKSWQNKVYSYVKLEADYRFTDKRPKSEIATRFFTGIGIPKSGQSIPFFKQFFAGGPNSMRAWGLRQLGLGSSIVSDTISSTSFRDRFGDLQIEANFEYRFNLATFGSFKIGSALFTDIGNVWNIRSSADNPGAEFKFDRLYKDLAVGVGTGIRFDFSYFLIRIDFAYKVKDPGRLTNNGWMSFKDFKWAELRNNYGQTEVRNYSFQLGIGLPF